MYSHILAPVDLVHTDRLAKALSTAADLARHYDILVTYVGVTAGTPGTAAHTPEEFAARLNAFAKAQAAQHGHKADAKMVLSHDPTTDVDDALLKVIEETGADLVVMASHVPGLADYIWPSNGGKVAAHSAASVFVVRTQE